MLGVTVVLCLSASLVWSETWDELVDRDGIYYKKFSDEPFTGKVKGKYTIKIDDSYSISFYRDGSLKNGKKHGSWISYYDNGNLSNKGVYKNGQYEGFWVFYWSNGKLSRKGHFKNGKENGFWEKYSLNGNPHKDTGTYKDGKKISD